MGRIGEADDIANAALFLASARSGWITGETITIARAGTPVADLVPHRGPAVRFGTLRLDYDEAAFLAADADVAALFDES